MTRPPRAGEPAAVAARDDEGRRVVVVTGVSGGGKTAAAKLFEDLGYVVVDNVPAELLADLAALVAGDPARYRRTAIVLDVRAGDLERAFGAMRHALEGHGIRPLVVFLDARDDVLVRRYAETRHRHPLDDRRGIAAAIAAERSVLDPIRAGADVVLDTSGLALRELRERLLAGIGEAEHPGRLAIHLISFGFKHGLPIEADIVLDVRFLHNPHWVEELRPLTGLDEPVRRHVLGQPLAEAFRERLQALLEVVVPAYAEEGRARLAIAIGCTGGIHRSVVLVEELARWLRARDLGDLTVTHRELPR